MTKSKQWEEHIVILLESHPDAVDGKVEDGEGKPANEEDGDHADEQPTSPRTSDKAALNTDKWSTFSFSECLLFSSHSSPDYWIVVAYLSVCCIWECWQYQPKLHPFIYWKHFFCTE